MSAFGHGGGAEVASQDSGSSFRLPGPPTIEVHLLSGLMHSHFNIKFHPPRLTPSPLLPRPGHLLLTAACALLPYATQALTYSLYSDPGNKKPSDGLEIYNNEMSALGPLRSRPGSIAWYGAILHAFCGGHFSHNSRVASGLLPLALQGWSTCFGMGDCCGANPSVVPLTCSNTTTEEMDPTELTNPPGPVNSNNPSLNGKSFTLLVLLQMASQCSSFRPSRPS